MPDQLPKFLIVNRNDVRDRRIWSGIPYQIATALEEHSRGVLLCDQLGYPRSLRLSLENRLLRYSGTTPFFRPRIAEHYASQIRGRLRNLDPDWDLLLAVDCAVEVARLDIDRPIVFFTDASYASLIATAYPGYDRFSRRAQASIRAIEAECFDRAARVVLSSQWAADEVVREYCLSEEKVKVAPMGANLDRVPGRLLAVEDGPWDHPERCELLFLGVDWERKQGQLALEVTEALNLRGLPTRLTVCGTTPPRGATQNLEVIPFLNKNESADMERLEGLLARSSYLILPSRAECYGLVFCEAAAYGLPSVSCDVGGISQIVEHGRTGFLLPPDAPAGDFAELVIENFRDDLAYREMRKAARDRYESLLNWQQWAAQMIDVCAPLR